MSVKGLNVDLSSVKTTSAISVVLIPIQIETLYSKFIQKKITKKDNYCKDLHTLREETIDDYEPSTTLFYRQSLQLKQLVFECC